MRKIPFIPVIIFVTLLPLTMFGQHTTVLKGILHDSLNHIIPANAVISVLNQSDSTLVAFARSQQDGTFQIDNLRRGRYFFLITYPGYADYSEMLSWKEPEINLGKIHLTVKSALLQEVIIRQEIMRLRGDTTEYVGDSFYVKPNATVEDLLKELPGIQVDKNGQITAQGQRVERILVDGEEFFSDDPTIATRNLRADAVSKVQIFDKRSDQSELSGIRDGSTTKTLNLELKASAKKGYFGKVSAGGLEKYYDGQAFINGFKGKRKLSAFTIATNTPETGLSFDEAGKYGFDKDVEIDEVSGTIFINSGAGNEMEADSYMGEGLPESIKAGLHYSNKFGGDRWTINGNYLFNRLREYKDGNSVGKHILRDSTYYTKESGKSNRERLRNSVQAHVQLNIDSTSSLKLSLKGFTGRYSGNDTYHSETISEANKIINKGSRKTNSDGTNRSLNATLVYRKKFRKPGNTLSWIFSGVFYRDENSGLLEAASSYPGRIIPFIQDTIDQRKESVTYANNLLSKMTYTTAISGRSFLEFNYLFSNTSNAQKRSGLNKDGNLKYTDRVDSLSINYNFAYQTNSAGIYYKLAGPNYNLSMGTNVAQTSFRQQDVEMDTSGKYTSYNLFPAASLQYRFSATSNINISYTGKSIQPTIDQLQPLFYNNDPLRIVVGNPNLRQAFENEIQISYSRYQPVKQRYLFFSAFLTHTANMIGTSYKVDTFGRRVLQYVNTGDGYSFASGAGYNLKIPGAPLRLSLGPAITLSNYENYINGEKNRSTYTYIALRAGLKTAGNTPFSLSAGFIPSFNSSTTTISKAAGVQYFNYAITFNPAYRFPPGFEAGFDSEISLRQKIDQFDQNHNILLLNPYLEKKFLPNEGLALRLSVYDVLNQNKGIVRDIYPYYTEERSYLTYKRYAMIRLSYNFVNKGGNALDTDDTIRL